jgi:hypothetical protein
MLCVHFQKVAASKWQQNVKHGNPPSVDIQALLEVPPSVAE